MLTSFRIDMVLAAAMGAFGLWMRLKYGASFLQGIERLVSDILDDFCPRMLLQITFFVLFGAVAAVIMVGPTTLRQAMAAGMSWTALLGGLATASTRQGRAKRGGGNGNNTR